MPGKMKLSGFEWIPFHEGSRRSAVTGAPELAKSPPASLFPDGALRRDGSVFYQTATFGGQAHESATSAAFAWLLAWW